MPRADFRFSFPKRVRYAECDPQGIVFNSRYLEYLDIGITEYWRAAGIYALSPTAMGAAQLGTAATASHAVVAPPRTTGPVHAQATLMVDAMPPPAATMMAPPPPAADAMPRRMTAAPMAVPQNHTLVLSTPPGFTSGAPRKKSGAWIAIGAVVAVIGAVVAVVVLSGGGSDDAAAVTETSDAGGEVAGQAQPDLAFHAGIDVIRVASGGGRRAQPGLRHEAGGRA